MSSPSDQLPPLPIDRCGFVANLGCSDRAAGRIERRLENGLIFNRKTYRVIGAALALPEPPTQPSGGIDDGDRLRPV